ncbi:MAG: hypothetical protein N2050_01520 [Flavobacteriales bacterium]|nr:hypothetical protein [Flavobacteriales bacterium]MCX7649217.1 hypothetical protein [Flavobacteriales bacterium]MDW8431257.1 hypothetical protein [Flavobacteriales bacterium]
MRFKKISLNLFSLLTIASASLLFSCKKDWTCECKTDMGDGSTFTTSSTIADKTKKDARDICNKSDVTMGGTLVTDCELK